MQLDIIYILWLRQMKRYLRSRSRVLGAIGQPLLFLLALGYGLGSVTWVAQDLSDPVLTRSEHVPGLTAGVPKAGWAHVWDHVMDWTSATIVPADIKSAVAAAKPKPGWEANTSVSGRAYFDLTNIEQKKDGAKVAPSGTSFDSSSVLSWK